MSFEDRGRNPSWRDEPIEEGYETPFYDALMVKHRKFVGAYLQCNDVKHAAIAAGYKAEFAAHRGWTLARRPDIVKAIDEMTGRSLLAAESQRSSMITRLIADSNVTVDDVCKRRTDKMGADRGQWELKDVEEIDPMYRRSAGLVTVTREGNPVLNMTAQNTARKLLASYMKWDREEAQVAPAVSYNFGDLKGPDAPSVQPEVEPPADPEVDEE